MNALMNDIMHAYTNGLVIDDGDDDDDDYPLPLEAGLLNKASLIRLSKHPPRMDKHPPRMNKHPLCIL